jgi:hypothetical protein
LFAVAEISFNKPLKGLSFSLNNSLTIEKIENQPLSTNQKHPVKWEKTGEHQLEFRALSQKIEVSSEHPIADLAITYSGPIDVWCNVITEDIKALSWYSVWFPQEIPFEGTVKDEVIIENGEEFFVVKGVFDESRKIWRYSGEGYAPLPSMEKLDPFNIIVYKRTVLKQASNEYINIYYVDPDIGSHAGNAEMAYKNILSFYNGRLFEQKTMPVMDIACVSPALTIHAAYLRKALMFCTTLGSNDLEIEYQLAHETAHNWCQGADASTWEDWLNETTAEWAVLLYALENNKDELFHFVLDQKAERIGNYPPIKTADGSRPEGVHDKGTVLFYAIYQKYGKEIVAKMVSGFASLQAKNTESFIRMAELEINREVAEAIRTGIEK